MAVFLKHSKRHRPFWKSGLSLHVIVGQRGRCIRLSPLLLLLAVGAVVLVVRQHRLNEAAVQAQYESRIADLEKEKHQVQMLLQRKDREKKQALALAESRSEELWDEIHSRDQQMDQLWEAVGKPKPSSSLTTRCTPPRGGVRTLQLKRRYQELYNAVEGRQGEIVALKQAAVEYRRDKLRRAQAKQRQSQALAWSTVPSIFPCDGPITSPFGYRVHPVLGYARFHSGMDIAAGYGQSICATAAGRVTCSNWLGGYGQAIMIDHGRGISTLYGHCSRLCVSQGQYVRKGQLVANVGSTGMSTGPHCHYEVRQNGNPIDPLPYLPRR